jgi:hypothetical protein
MANPMPDYRVLIESGIGTCFFLRRTIACERGRVSLVHSLKVTGRGNTIAVSSCEEDDAGM